MKKFFKNIFKNLFEKTDRIRPEATYLHSIRSLFYKTYRDHKAHETEE